MSSHRAALLRQLASLVACAMAVSMVGPAALTVATTPAPATAKGSLRGLRAVIWDVDGTLVDSTRLAHDATNTVLRANGYPEINQDQYCAGCGYATPNRFAFHVSGNPDDARGPMLAQEFDELYIKKVSPATVPLYEGLRELIQLLQVSGCRLGVLSNACTAYVRAVLATHGMSEDFEQQLGADAVPAGKPSPAGLLQVCREMGLAPSDCAYVGDAPNDGKAARAAGMRGIGVMWDASAHDAARDVAFDEVVSTALALQSALMEGPTPNT